MSNKEEISDKQFDPEEECKCDICSKKEKTIEELLERLGNNFRGLWKSYYLDENDEPNINKWTVTFIYKNHYVETPDFDNPKEALLWAINKLSNS